MTVEIGTGATGTVEATEIAVVDTATEAEAAVTAGETAAAAGGVTAAASTAGLAVSHVFFLQAIMNLEETAEAAAVCGETAVVEALGGEIVAAFTPRLVSRVFLSRSQLQ